MSDVALEDINLNLLPVLRALLKQRSVSGAATALERSPSAISVALSQLRVELKDQLLVRVGGHLRLTPRAAELIGPVEDLHERLQSFFRGDLFDPGRSTRTFTVASSDLLIDELGPDMVRVLRASGPAMSLHFVDIGSRLTEQMAEREIDFAMLPEFAVEDLAPAPIKFQPLYESARVALMCRSHPLARKRSVTRLELNRYRHIAFRPDAVLLDGLRRRAAGPDVHDDDRYFDRAVLVSQFLTIPRLLVKTDLVAVVPRQIADAAVRALPVVAIKLGYKSDRPRLGLAWSAVFDHDKAHRWFRKAIAEQRQTSRSVAT